ncbi:MAG: TPM domain-containing protein, partial [Patescibacteria group bacterium]
MNDFAWMLSPDQKFGLEQKLVQFEKESSNEISVVTISNLQGDSIENFAVKLFEEWKIGKAKNDNGILLLIVRDDRKMRIEVGYGLEGAIPDATAYSIITNILTPTFKQGDYFGGINSAVDAMMSATKGEYQPASDSERTTSWSAKTIENFFWFGLIIIIWISSALARSKSW